MRRPSIVLTLFVGVFLAGCRAQPDVVFEAPPPASASSAASAASASAAPVPAAVASSSVSSRPRSVQIRVPFAAQAPLGDWEQPYQDACEEASLILVHHYLTGKPLTPEIMDQEILDLVAWEEQRGYGHDVSAAEVVDIARAYYGYQARLQWGVTEAALEAELSAGRPVILPVAGRDLDNPYYSGEGPWYHMLVLTGFDEDRFITSDVGTKRGANYAYDRDVLFDAIHDFTGVKEEIRSGPKAMIVVTR